jgi:peptidoglycan/LPS O-acetylase OafA/YrhL
MIAHSSFYNVISNFGWAGVDLFFVLSGFLISGLLFSEYKKNQNINFKRFFIRRGFKIYPAYYVFLFLTALTWYFYLHVIPVPSRYIHDVFFVMNYLPGNWGYTWSLAIEEHFYILLPVFLLILIRLSPDHKNPFRTIPWAFAIVAIACIGFRAATIYVPEPNFTMAYEGTHNRMDALFSGVLVSYVHHFHPHILDSFMRSTIGRVSTLIATGGFLVPVYFHLLPRKGMATYGYTFVYCGFVGLLLLSLYVSGILSAKLGRVIEPFGNIAAYVGVYSYSIYLWHGPCGTWLPGLVRRLLHFPQGENGRIVVYVVGSLVIGIGMSRLIEYPVLHLRERLLPGPGIAVASSMSVTPEQATHDACKEKVAELTKT